MEDISGQLRFVRNSLFVSKHVRGAASRVCNTRFKNLFINVERVKRAALRFLLRGFSAVREKREKREREGDRV